MAKFVARIGVLLLATVVGLIAIEGLVRLVGLDRPILWRPDAKLGWHHVPGARRHFTEEGDGQVHINRLGMRDVERSETKAPGVFRIAVFGDSMTEGVQVDLDKTYTQQLEANLRRRGLSVEVLNFGVNGYSPLQELLLYREVGAAFKPDLVVQAVFLDNDVADGHPRLATNQGDGPRLASSTGGSLAIDFSGPERSVREYSKQPVASIRKFSALYRFVGGVHATMRNAGAAAATAAASVPKRYLLYEQPEDQAWTEAWARLDRVIAAFASSVRNDGARFVLVSVPAGQVINSSAWDALLEGNPAMRAKRWDLLGPETRLAAIASRIGVPLLTTNQHFRQLPGPQTLFFGQVGHFTPRGHEMLAALMEPWLINNAFIPRRD